MPVRLVTGGAYRLRDPSLANGFTHITAMEYSAGLGRWRGVLWTRTYPAHRTDWCWDSRGRFRPSPDGVRQPDFYRGYDLVGPWPLSIDVLTPLLATDLTPELRAAVERALRAEDSVETIR